MGRVLALGQGGYFLLTGLWPILDIESFMLVTGPKFDIWLVHTVGALAASVGAGLLYAAAQRQITFPVVVVAGATALSFMLIDIIYVSRQVILPVYLLDAGVELLFLLGWVMALASGKFKR